MTELNEIYELRGAVKGWPVEDAGSLDDASHMILGSPYWDVPEDRYVVIDKNDTYSLVAVVTPNGNISRAKRYMVVNMDFDENSRRTP